MTTITILPEKEDIYRALAGDKESTGRTAGEALDALTSQLSNDEGGTLVIVQDYKADEFFDTAQQARLTELMQFRQAQALSSEEGRELEGLVEVELDGARRRTMGGVSQQSRELLSTLSDLLNRDDKFGRLTVEVIRTEKEKVTVLLTWLRHVNFPQELEEKKG